MRLKRTCLRKALPLLAGLALSLFSAASLYSEESVRCDGSILNVGDLQLEVKEKCGEPTEIIEYTEYTIIHNLYINSHTHRHKLVSRYILEYNQSDSYLDALSLFRRRDHSHDDILKRKEKYEDDKERFSQRREVFIQKSEIRSLREEYDLYWRCKKYEDHFQEWVYNLGDNRFIRIITFLRGRVVKIDHAGYGF